MFAIAPTLAAIIVCMAGLDSVFDGSCPALSLWALAVLAVVPLGEVSVLEAKLRRRRGKGGIGPLWFTLLGILPPAGYGVAVLLFGLPRLVAALGIESWTVVDEALLIIPYLGAAALGRVYRHRRAAVFDPGRTWRRCRAEILLGFRGEIALLVPFLCFILLGDLLSLDKEIEKTITSNPALTYGLLLTCLLVLLALFPPLLKVLWRLKPLPSSFPLRGELARFIAARRFKVRDILVWGTGGLMVNAAILGFLPRWRYILLTDSMLGMFSREELKAVIAHEIGHGRKKHTFFFVVLSIGFVAGLALLDENLHILDEIGDSLLAAGAFYLPIVLGYVWFLFGFLSRRFEVEADVFAVETLGSRALFAGTLDRLGRLNAAARKRKSWRHFSIDRRIEILERFFPETSYPDGADPEAEDPIATGSQIENFQGTAPSARADQVPAQDRESAAATEPPPPDARRPVSSAALDRFRRRMAHLKVAAILLSAAVLILFVVDAAV